MTHIMCRTFASYLLCLRIFALLYFDFFRIVVYSLFGIVVF